MNADLERAKDELRNATEALIEYSGNGWPLTPVEVAAAQLRYDEALDAVIACAISSVAARV